MENVYILFSADQWLSKVSYNVIGIFTEKHRAINAAKERNGYNLTENDLNNLEHINQTQSLDVNYVIEKRILNQID